MKKNTNQQEKEFPVREGSEESSVLHDKQPPQKNKYPQSEEKDKQVQQQPEFKEEQPNRRSPNSPVK
jgi:hypothetical protein